MTKWEHLTAPILTHAATQILSSPSASRPGRRSKSRQA